MSPTPNRTAFKDPFLKSRYPPWSAHYLDYPRLLAILRPEENGDSHTLNVDLACRRKSVIAVRRKSVTSLPEDSVTRFFIERLDDEIDRVTLFVLKQQGLIADMFLDLQNISASGEFGGMTKGGLYSAAHELLHLIDFLQANILAIDKLLTVHDRIAPAGIKIEHLFLAGKIGREKAMRTSRSVQRGRLRVAYHHDGVKTLVGLAETVYFQWLLQVRSVRTTRDLTWTKFQEQNAKELSTKENSFDIENLNRLSREQSLVSLLPIREDEQCCDSKDTSIKTVGSIREIYLRIDMALHRLSKSSSFVERWAMASGIERDDPFSLDDDPVPVAKKAKHQRARDVSSWLNLVNSFLYMVSYYMVAPTSGKYAEKLGLSPSMSGAIVGFTAFSALVSTVLYSWWTSYSYKNALIFSSVCCLVGNVIYAMGLPFNSLTLVLAGRFLNGFGSARAINRRFIADAFSNVERTAASAAFVASGAAGMSCGPALSAIMPLIVGDSNLWWQEENAPAWIVAVLWGVFLAVLIPCFNNPPKIHKKIVARISDKSNSNGSQRNKSNGEVQPLIHRGKPSTREIPIWERPVCLITIFLVFLLKLVLELVLSSAAPIAGYYFDWSPSLTGWYLAIGNGLVLPAVSLVTYLSRYYEDRQLILFSQVLMLVGSLVVIHIMPNNYSYPVIQYILGTCILFVAPNTMEGPSMSLLSKNIPKSLATGIFNLGFFTTEAGFGGRVVADSYLTIVGGLGIDRLLNYLFGSLAIVNACTLSLVYIKFGDLVEPNEEYD